jgi:V8-like Glu-specific endopeptidase
MKLANYIVAGTLISSALWTAPLLADDFSGGNKGNGEAPRGGVSDHDFSLHEATPLLPRVEKGEASRAAPITDEDAVIKSLTAVGRSADGKDLRIEPSDSLKKAVSKMLTAPAGAGASRTSAPRRAGDPIFKTGDEGSRKVFGEDDRVEVDNTTAYPYSAIGYLESRDANGQYESCSATLIGPSTVLTAAHCLYNHNTGAWQDQMRFLPGLHGWTNDDVPFGSYAYKQAYVVQGYIDNYQGFYGSVLAWDLGIVTLKEAIGDRLGWLGYANYEDLGEFTANIVGYPGDKPSGTMWATTCDVSPEDVGEGYLQYDCDTYPGSSGSAVYSYDKDKDERVILGVNVAESDEANTAIRINAVYLGWINSIN